MEQLKNSNKDFIQTLVCLLAFSFVFLFSSLALTIKHPIKEDAIELNVEEPTLSYNETILLDKETLSKEMQQAVINHCNQDDMGLTLYRDIQHKTKVIWFYNQITNNEDVTTAILNYADINDIPLSLAFSLAWTESRFKSSAVNKNTNASIDRGLFQLNSNSFPTLTEKEFFDPYTSAKYGLSHLRYCLDTAGNEIAALAMYNAGANRVRKNGTPQITLNYVSTIMDYQKGLDELFTTQIASKASEQTTFLAMSLN